MKDVSKDHTITVTEDMIDNAKYSSKATLGEVILEAIESHFENLTTGTVEVFEAEYNHSTGEVLVMLAGEWTDDTKDYRITISEELEEIFSYRVDLQPYGFDIELKHTETENNTISYSAYLE